MSWEGLTWAIRQQIFPSSRKFVLVILGNYCGDTGLSYPSVRTIASATGLTDETITKSLDSLVSEGIIEDTGKRAGDTRRIRVFKLPEEAHSIGYRETNTPKNRGIESPDNTPKKQGIKYPTNPRQIPEESSNPPEPHILKESEPEPYFCGKTKLEERFKPPLLEECLVFGETLRVKVGGQEHGILPEDVSAFFDHFTSNGWKVSGRAAMKDWRAAMQTWARNSVKFRRNETTYGKANGTNGAGGRNLGQVGQRPTVAQQRNAQITGSELVRAGIRADQANAAPPPWADYK